MRRADPQYDVAIVGAGPAGSTAAIELARTGRRVLLIEKQRFPRQKVCGGCLSGPTVAALNSLLGPGRAIPGSAGTSITFVFGNQRAACKPAGQTWMAARPKLDACLFEAAAESGAEIMEGEAATLARGEFGWEVQVGAHRIQATHVLIASGLGGLAQQIGIPGRTNSRPMLAQQWIQPATGALPRTGAVELHWLRGGYVGLATPEADCCVVALAAHASAVSGSPAFEGLRRLNPKALIWDILLSDAPRRHGAKGTAGFPWVPQRLGIDNVLLIGDAAGYAEPFSGAGIGQAIDSAHHAAHAIVNGVELQRNYAAMMRGQRWKHRRTRFLSGVLNQIAGMLPTFGPSAPIEWLLSRCVERIHVRGRL